MTVNAQRYVSMLENFFEPQLEQLGEETDLGDIWFQQDGAIAHTSRISMTKLRQMFPGRLVSLRGDVLWPACSPDLRICDFFLWGHPKGKVYQHRLHTLEELKNQIREEIAAIPIEMCRNAVESFKNRLHQYIGVGAIIFRTLSSKLLK